MASNATKSISGSFSSAIGNGMSSLINPSDKTYYILEHCVTSKFHQMGEAQRIILDNIEIGRDPRCQVRFDEDFKTVSRRHAAIVRDGDNWKLVQISKTNSTLLNGRRIDTEWYLQSGDEIQISVNGPKLRFIIPDGNNSRMGTINFTQRFNLFAQQALKPYKYGLIAVGACLVLAIAAIVYLTLFVNNVANDVKDQQQMLAEAIEDNQNNAEVVDSLARQLATMNASLVNINDVAQRALRTAHRAADNGTPAPAAFAALSKDVYYIVVTFYYQGTKVLSCSGTGFLLDDGRFVTAKHCIDFSYIHEQDLDDNLAVLINSAHNYQSSDVEYKLQGISGNGDYIEYSYTPQQWPWVTGDTEYTVGTVDITDESGEVISFPIKYSESTVGDDDWAYIILGRSGGLAYDAEWSSNLSIGTELHILGFPRNVGTEELMTTNRVSPNYVSSKVSQNGLYNGIIMLASDPVDHGNSGGPVFAQRNGKLYVVGIISGKERLGFRNGNANYDAQWRSRVVPISALTDFCDL